MVPVEGCMLTRRSRGTVRIPAKGSPVFSVSCLMSSFR